MLLLLLLLPWFVCGHTRTAHTHADPQQVSTIKFDGDIVAGMRFGPYMRHDNTLACVFKSGALAIKMLRRGASLEMSTAKPGPPPEQGMMRVCVCVCFTNTVQLVFPRVVADRGAAAATPTRR